MNFGIWNAAAGPWRELQERYGISSEIWFPANPANASLPEGLEAVELESVKTDELPLLIQKRNLSIENTLVMTHGAWQFPTRWGKAFAAKGYRWCYVPHGMLEPWSMSQKRLKKLLYFRLFEAPAVHRANLIRAVGLPEQENLRKSLHREIVLIPNGVENRDFGDDKDYSGTIRFLFLSRLHHKKGIVPLARAWAQSSLANDQRYELLIAGPDQGEVEKVNEVLMSAEISNAKYIGPVYDKEKEELLRSSHWFVLPSQSEGFPTSVLEAMQYGLFPVISEGCNFPEAIEQGMAVLTGISEKMITETLEQCKALSAENLGKKSLEVRSFVRSSYSLDRIAEEISEALGVIKNKN